MLQYWQADYADLIQVARTASQAEDADSIDPEMRVLAANALYRVAQRGPQDRPTLLKNLDAAIRAYNEALRAGIERPDIAFNYELAVRMRDEIGAGKRKALTNAKTDDTESDPNMHGDPGRAAQGYEGGAVPDQDSDGPEGNQAEPGAGRGDGRCAPKKARTKARAES